MEWRDLLTIGGFIFGISGTLGGAAAYFYRSRAKGLIELQNGEIDILKDKTREFDKCQQKLDEALRQIEFLKGMVTQAPQIGTLTESVNSLANMMHTSLVYMGVINKKDWGEIRKKVMEAASGTGKDGEPEFSTKN